MRKLALLAIAVAACSDASGPGSSVMTALVNGASFTAQTPPDRQVGLLDTSSFSMLLTLVGTQAISSTRSENLFLNISGFHGVGQYSTCGSGSTAFGMYFQVDVADTTFPPFYTSDSSCGGEVDVQSYVPALLTISGTFHFAGTSLVAPDTVRVTDGRFDGKIQISDIVIGTVSIRRAHGQFRPLPFVQHN